MENYKELIKGLLEFDIEILVLFTEKDILFYLCKEFEKGGGDGINASDYCSMYGKEITKIIKGYAATNGIKMLVSEINKQDQNQKDFRIEFSSHFKWMYFSR